MLISFRKNKTKLILICSTIILLILYFVLSQNYLTNKVSKIKFTETKKPLAIALKKMDSNFNNLDKDSNLVFEKCIQSKSIDSISLKNLNDIDFLMILDSNFKKISTFTNDNYCISSSIINDTIIKNISKNPNINNNLGLLLHNNSPIMLKTKEITINHINYFFVSVKILDTQSLVDKKQDNNINLSYTNNNINKLSTLKTNNFTFTKNVYFPSDSDIEKYDYNYFSMIEDFNGNPTIKLSYNFNTYSLSEISFLHFNFLLLIFILNLSLFVLIFLFLKFNYFSKISKIDLKISKIFSDLNLSTTYKIEPFENNKLNLILSNLADLDNYLKECGDKFKDYLDHDNLTNLLTSESFLKLHYNFEDESEKYGLLYINIEGFSLLNQTLGCSTGDLILQNIANLICIKSKKAKNYEIARIGGNEFAVLSSFNSLDDLLNLAKSINDGLNNEIFINEHNYYISSSIGISYAPEHGKSISKLLSTSYLAMNESKKRGMNQTIVFNPNYETKITLEMLQNALNNNELQLHYQPKINAYTGRIVGVEALIRWFHPELGYIPPPKFVSLAEQTGYILTLGKWILEQACIDMNTFYKMTKSRLKVAVNISSIQFFDKTFMKDVINILSKTKYPAKYLEIELTETIGVVDSERLKKLIDHLQKLHITIAIDDFCTGYNSINYLQQYSIDIVKLDKTFIDTGSENPSLLKGIIDVIHSIDAKVVAEGIENAYQYKILKDFGCDILQGYYFYKPIPLNELINKVNKTLI